ncbi:hypothetical protein ACFX2G_013526 [Malus domestica]
MPILKAKGEIEALCAQLNGDNHVDVCITFDSDAYLFEAKCVIKTFRSNSKEPFEWYYMSDIEAGLGLKRNHLIAPSLLAENDHDLNGVQWLDTTLCFGQTFSEDEINRLGEIGSCDASVFQGGMHPNSKRAHFKSSCEFFSNAVGDSYIKVKRGSNAVALHMRLNSGSPNVHFTGRKIV